MATSRDGLVGYDAALTQLRSGVRFPLFVLVLFVLLPPNVAFILLSLHWWWWVPVVLVGGCVGWVVLVRNAENLP